MSEPLKVVAAAILKNGKVYTLPPPARHHTIIQQIFDETSEKTRSCDDQGFLLSDGRFVLRPAALQVARKAGQVTDIIGSVLTSEDLW
jgi:hypothetical protein